MSAAHAAISHTRRPRAPCRHASAFRCSAGPSPGSCSCAGYCAGELALLSRRPATASSSHGSRMWSLAAMVALSDRRLCSSRWRAFGASWRAYQRTRMRPAATHRHLLEAGAGRTRFLALWGVLLGRWLCRGNAADRGRLCAAATMCGLNDAFKSYGEVTTMPARRRYRCCRSLGRSAQTVPRAGAGQRGVHTRADRPCPVAADAGGRPHRAERRQCARRMTASGHAVEELRLDPLLVARPRSRRRTSHRLTAAVHLLAGRQQGPGGGADRRGQHHVRRDGLSRTIVYALDLTKPGAPLKWKFAPKPLPASQGVACCDVVNRGGTVDTASTSSTPWTARSSRWMSKTGKAVWRTRLGNINIGETMTMAPTGRRRARLCRQFRRRAGRARLDRGAR